MLADSHNILNRWKNYFYQLMISGRQMHKVELLVPEPCFLEVEIATEKLKRYKSPSTVEILAELIQA